MLVGALVAGEEVRAVVGGEEGLQRADAGDEEDEVVLAAELEGGVDDVVADAFGAEVDLEAVGEEGEEVVDCSAIVDFDCVNGVDSQLIELDFDAARLIVLVDVARISASLLQDRR